MVSFILVNNNISRGQLQYTDNVIYTNNSDDVNAETLQSSEKGHIPHANCVCGRVYCFHVVRPSVRPNERTNESVSVTFCFLNKTH